MEIMYISHFLVFLLYLALAEGLTTYETQQFQVSGNFAGASVNIQTFANTHQILASGIPDHGTERVNPNTATNQNFNITIQRAPVYSQIPGCVPMGIIGITRTGVAIFNPLNAEQENAVDGPTAETFDSCDGHADQRGTYHYHKIPDSCLYRGDVDEFIGVALDGYPIYGPRVSYQVAELKSSDLDRCHGTNNSGQYRYHVTREFPYFLGCFKGIVQGYRVTHDCANTSAWENTWGHYLCSCQTGGGGGGNPCDPRNPNRPSSCPPPSRPPTTLATANRTTTGSMVTRPNLSTSRSPNTTGSSSKEGLSTEEIQKFGATATYGATVSVETVNENFVIKASGLPDHVTQTFNNNHPTAQNYEVTIPKTPRHAAVPGCVGLGMIGITRTGVAIYNPLTGGLENAVEGASQEQFDSCDGHASPNGAYHYHKIPDSCLYSGQVEEFIGVALDGFPIYGPRVTSTQNITEEELDKCHGKYVNGKYRYYVTQNFPYFMGCFKGFVINSMTTTEYNCSSDVSPWNRQTFSHHNPYLCHCQTNTGGMGGGPGGGTMRPECHPRNVNRPSDCPDCSGPAPPPGCPSQRPSPTTQGTLQNTIGGATANKLSLISLSFSLIIFILS